MANAAAVPSNPVFNPRFMNPSTPVIEKQRSAIGTTDHAGDIH
jgi:hypothetical protein